MRRSLRNLVQNERPTPKLQQIQCFSGFAEFRLRSRQAKNLLPPCGRTLGSEYFFALLGYGLLPPKTLGPLPQKYSPPPWEAAIRLAPSGVVNRKRGNSNSRGEDTTMIYLLHYDRPLHHAQHYLGSCDDPQRIQDHGNGTSRARLPHVFCQLGVQFVVARTWEGGRTGERKLKNQKNARVLCPICRTAKLTIRANQKQDRRAQRKLPFADPPEIFIVWTRRKVSGR